MSSENSSSKKLSLLSELPILEQPPEADQTPEAQANMLLELDTLATLATRLSAAESLLSLLVKDIVFSDFMRDVLLSFLKSIKCEAGSILEVDYTRNVLFFRAVAGQSSHRLSSVSIPWGSGVVGYVAESKSPVIIQDTNHDPRYLRSVSVSVGFESRNLVAIPIVVRGRVFAVLELFNRVGKPCFDEQDLELMTHLAHYAARVIEVRLMLNGARKGVAA
ncbi:MAG: GAF domain-containing protein [Bdellovibrionales bacterium]|nr:GAF domain-containing protein [Bdellovibrionales bacterium]